MSRGHSPFLCSAVVAAYTIIFFRNFLLCVHSDHSMSISHHYASLHSHFRDFHRVAPHDIRDYCRDYFHDRTTTVTTTASITVASTVSTASAITSAITSSASSASVSTIVFSDAIFERVCLDGRVCDWFRRCEYCIGLLLLPFAVIKCFESGYDGRRRDCYYKCEMMSLRVVLMWDCFSSVRDLCHGGKQMVADRKGRLEEYRG